MDESMSRLRHATRGCLNALKLCVSAFEVPLSSEDQAQFLDDIARASDKMCSLLDQIQAIEPATASTPPSIPPASDSSTFGAPAR